MSWISHLSLNRALAIACAWPITLVAGPAVVLGLARVYGLWINWRTDGAEVFFFRLRLMSWPLAGLVLLLPPGLFLAAWWLVRAGLADRAT